MMLRRLLPLSFFVCGALATKTPQPTPTSLTLPTFQTGPTFTAHPVVAATSAPQPAPTKTFLPMIQTGPTLATHYVVVSTSGSDSTGDGTLAKPWRNLSYAVSQAGTPGTTIYLRGGSYNYGGYDQRDETWIRQDAGLGGSPGNFLTIEPYPGEVVEMDYERIIIDASYVRVRGLHLIDVGLGIVNWHGHPDHVELLDNVITGPDLSYGAITTSGDYLLIEGNTIKLTGVSGLGSESHGIYLGWGSHNIVRGNVIAGATGYGIHLYDEDKYPGFTPTFGDVVIEGNVVTGARLRSGMIVSAAAGVTIDGVIVRNNVFGGNNHVGLLIGPYGGSIHDVRVYNNVFYRNGARSGVALFVSEGTLGDVRISNNIFEDSVNTACTSNCDWFEAGHISAPAGVPNVTVARNLYFPQALGLAGVGDSEALYGDPVFVAADAGDFHLGADSPAHDAGLRLTDVATDKDGVGRPQGTADDLGIYER